MKTILEVASQYKKVWIQSHDSPDADSIASSFGMSYLFDKLGVPNEMIYFGNIISKPNLLELIDKFDIKINNKGHEFKVPDDELLLVVDGQRGSRNVYSFTAQNVAVLDHHMLENHFDYVYSNIQSKLGSCSTLIHMYLKAFNIRPTTAVATSLYFGLMTDTNNFVVKYTNLDADCKDELDSLTDEKAITKLVRTSLTFEDIMICTKALESIERYGDIVFSRIGDADDNLLGHISDLVSEIAGINIVVLCSERRDGYKFSIRSYHEFITAENIIQVLVNKIGSGGGHMNKSGGYVPRNDITAKVTGGDIFSYSKDKVINFCRDFIYLVEGIDNPYDLFEANEFQTARKKNYNVRVVKLSNFFNPDEQIEVKTLEGKVYVNSSEYVIIGARGELYPITKRQFDSRYVMIEDQAEKALCDNYMSIYGVSLTGRDTNVVISSDSIKNFTIARTEVSDTVQVIKLDAPTKIKRSHGEHFTRGDAYLIFKDINNYFLCNSEIFEETYELL